MDLQLHMSNKLNTGTTYYNSDNVFAEADGMLMLLLLIQALQIVVERKRCLGHCLGRGAHQKH